MSSSVNPARGRPKLTVAIPTFNRARFLEQTLTALRGEIESARTQDVAVLVVDNCSDDGTADLCGRFGDAMPMLTYVRNESNVGAERNIMRCARLSTGQFTWIFGDDDLPVPGALGGLLSTVAEAPEIDLYLMNYAQLDRELAVYLCTSVLGQTEDVDFSGLREFYGLMGSGEILNFISACVFRTDRIAKTAYEAYVECGSYYGHVGALIEAFHDRPCRYVGKPMVKQRQGNQRIDTIDGKRGDTFRYDLNAYGGFLRLLARLLEAGTLAPGDVDTITVKRMFGPIHKVECVGILDWWTDRLLKPSVKAAISGEPGSALAELRPLVAAGGLGRAGARIRNILDLVASVCLALETLERL